MHSHEHLTILFPESQASSLSTGISFPLLYQLAKECPAHGYHPPLASSFQKLRGKLLIFQDLVVKSDWFTPRSKAATWMPDFGRIWGASPHISKGIREVTNLSRFAPFGAFQLVQSRYCGRWLHWRSSNHPAKCRRTNLGACLVDITLHLVAVFRANF